MMDVSNNNSTWFLALFVEQKSGKQDTKQYKQNMNATDNHETDSEQNASTGEEFRTCVIYNVCFNSDKMRQ